MNFPTRPITRPIAQLALSSLTLLALAGCATDDYTCPIPASDGGCRSVSHVYTETRNLADTTTPDSATPAATPAAASSSANPQTAETVLVAAVGAATPLKPTGPGDAVLSTPRVLRILVSPWQDADGDLQSGGYVYLRMDKGQWTVAQP